MNHDDEYREEENRRRWIQSERRRLVNRDPFYPDAYYEQDHAEELERLRKSEEE